MEMRVDIESRCTCRGEGSCNLGTHVSALAHTRNDDLAFAMIHHIYCLFKIVVQIRYLVEDGLCLVAESLLAIISYSFIIHYFINSSISDSSLFNSSMLAASLLP